MPPTPLSLSPDRTRPGLCRAGAQLRSLLCAAAEGPACWLWGQGSSRARPGHPTTARGVDVSAHIDPAVQAGQPRAPSEVCPVERELPARLPPARWLLGWPDMDEWRRDLADEERLCVCGHTRGAHLPEANQCAGEAQSVLLLCRCTGFQLNAFEVHPAESSKLSRVVFNGRDITNLLSDGEVYDNDDEFHTWQLRLRLSDDAWEQHVETARQLRRIAEHWPPYVAVIPEGMSAEQWVLKLT